MSQDNTNVNIVKNKLHVILERFIFTYFQALNAARATQNELNKPDISDIEKEYLSQRLEEEKEIFTDQSQDLLDVMRRFNVLPRYANHNNLYDFLKNNNITSTNDVNNIETSIVDRALKNVQMLYSRATRFNNSDDPQDKEVGKALTEVINSLNEDLEINFTKDPNIKKDLEASFLLGRDVSAFSNFEISGDIIEKNVDRFFENIRNVNRANVSWTLTGEGKNTDYINRVNKLNEKLANILNGLVKNGKKDEIEQYVINQYVDILNSSYEIAFISDKEGRDTSVVNILKNFDEEVKKFYGGSVLEGDRCKEAIAKTIEEIKQKIIDDKKFITSDRQVMADNLGKFWDEYLRKDQTQEKVKDPNKKSIFSRVKNMFSKIGNNIKSRNEARKLAKGITDSVKNTTLENDINTIDTKNVTSIKQEDELDLNNIVVEDEKDIVEEIHEEEVDIVEEDLDKIVEEDLNNTNNDVNQDEVNNQRQETGKNLTSVLNQVGVQKAKNDLINTLNKVKETKKNPRVVEGDNKKPEETNKNETKVNKPSRKAEGLYDELSEENKLVYDTIMKKSFTSAINELNPNELVYIHKLFKEETLRIISNAKNNKKSPKDLTQGEVQALAIYTKLKNKYNKLVKEGKIDLENIKDPDYKTQSDLLDLMANKVENTNKGRR